VAPPIAPTPLVRECFTALCRPPLESHGVDTGQRQPVEDLPGRDGGKPALGRSGELAAGGSQSGGHNSLKLGVWNGINRGIEHDGRLAGRRERSKNTSLLGLPPRWRFDVTLATSFRFCSVLRSN
jgi:hypothetical protein